MNNNETTRLNLETPTPTPAEFDPEVEVVSSDPEEIDREARAGWAILGGAPVAASHRQAAVPPTRVVDDGGQEVFERPASSVRNSSKPHTFA